MGKKKLTIAIMMRSIHSEFSEVMYSGFYDAAEEEGVDIVYLLGAQSPGVDMDFTDDDMDREYVDQLDSVYDYADLLKPDVLILVSGSLRKSDILPDINALVERYKNIPLLVLEAVPAKPSVSYQVADSYHPMCECVEHLVVDHQYKYIIYISGDISEYDYKEKLRAFVDTMKAHSISYDEDQIVECRNGESIERKINAVFDDFPYADAIICSSDEFARIVYRACNKRGLRIGRDIAVTGFDDIGMSHEMKPTLTGVQHDCYRFGREAVKRAISIAGGESGKGTRLACRFVKRNSCGCRMQIITDKHIGGPAPVDEEIIGKLHDYENSACKAAIDDIYAFLPYEAEKRKFSEIYLEMFGYIHKEIFTGWDNIEEVYIVTDEYIDSIMDFSALSARMITDKTIEILETIMYMIPHGKERAKLTAIMLHAFKQLKEAEIIRMRNTGARNREQLWFIPLFTKDLLNPELSDVDVLSTVMRRLRGMNVASAHFFIFGEPVVYRKGQLPPTPEKIHYAGFFDKSEMHAYTKNNSVNINLENGISSVLPDVGFHRFTSFVICSSERQYGIILYEIEKKDVFYAMMCTLQVGALFHFRDVNKLANEATAQVEAMNGVLGYVSGRDDLTGLYNGRGFMEGFNRLVSRNAGRQGYILIADISHLTEINGKYGHLTGDAVIKEAAEIFRMIVGDESIPSRIGDDEFISVILSDKYDMINSIRTSIGMRLSEYNDNSDLDFELDMRLAEYPVTLERGMDVSAKLREAGESLADALKPASGLVFKQS